MKPCSRRGQDRRGRRRSAAFSHNQPTLVGNAATCKVFVATCAHLNKTLQHAWALWHFCETPGCPDPVWRPVITACGAERAGSVRSTVRAKTSRVCFAAPKVKQSMIRYPCDQPIIKQEIAEGRSRKRTTSESYPAGMLPRRKTQLTHGP